MKTILCFLFVAAAQYLIACDCPPLKKIDREGAAAYDVIFRGRVDSVSSCRENLGTVYFYIEDLFKGMLTARVAIEFECSSSCMMSFEKNEEWIIYCVANTHGKLQVELCSHSRKFMKGDDYYAATSGQSFDDEVKFLRENLGNKRIREEGDMENQGQYDHQNMQPDGKTKLWLLGISLVVFILFYYLFNKYFR